MPVAPSNRLNNASYEVTTWTAETGTGLAYTLGPYSDITVQAVGAGTVSIEGSNDGTTWTQLSDVGGTPVSALTGGAFAVLREAPLKIRPVVTGTSTIILVARG